MKHTSEPWQFGHFGTESFWIGPNETTVSVAFVPHDCDSARDESRENASRIVACVNACAGISTDVLEAAKDGAALWDLVESAVQLTKQRDELISICKGVIANGIGFSDIEAMKAAIAKVQP